MSGAIVETYNDHRMAMAFAPLALKTSFSINEAEVVSKSFPDFWENLAELGFNISNLKIKVQILDNAYFEVVYSQLDIKNQV